MRILIAASVAAVIALGPCAAQGGSRPDMDTSIRVNGSPLHVQITGSGAPILFLHGGLQHYDNGFARLRTALQPGHKLIGVDQRGHGHSPDSRQPFSYQSMAEDTAEILEKLALGPVDVIGHSDGGNVALLLARDHPSLVRRMVISGANLRSGLSEKEFEERRRWNHHELAAKLHDVESHIPPSFRRDYEAVSPDGPGHWAVVLEKSYFLWAKPVVMPPADLSRISAPVLVVAGDHDFTTIEETAEIYRGLRQGQLLILPGSGHGTWEEDPALPALAIERFLQQP